MRKLLLLTVMALISWSIQAQNVGINQSTPTSKLDVNGGLSVGSSYSGTFAAPANGAIFEGNVGIGIESPEALLHVNGTQLLTGKLGIANMPDPLLGGLVTAIDTVDDFAQGVIYSEFKGDSASFNDKAGVFGQNVTDDYYGVGIIGEAGWTGVRGQVIARGKNLYYGVIGLVSNFGPTNGTAKNYGLWGEALGDSSINYGVYGNTYGISSTNYAGYFSGDLAYTGTLNPPSDLKLKKNISPLQNSLKKVMELQPKSYQFRTDEYEVMNLADGPQIGFIAQEAGAIFPQLMHENVFTKPSANKENITDPIEYVGFDYMSLIPVLTGAIQEQQEIINSQESEIQNLKSQLQNVISAMEKAGIKLN